MFRTCQSPEASTQMHYFAFPILPSSIDPEAWRDWGQEEKGITEDEMAGWHHRLNGHEFE